MKIKKRHLTLLEVMIALGLAMALLTVLATSHWQMIAIGVKAENERAQMFRHLLVQHRISSFLSHVKSSKYFYFSESDPYVGLVFTHDQANDLNKQFSNEVLTRLFVYDGKLWLATLPPPAKWTEEQPQLLVEELADEVTNFTITFTDNKGITSFNWPQERKELPVIISISMKIAGSDYKQKVVLLTQVKALEL